MNIDVHKSLMFQDSRIPDIGVSENGHGNATHAPVTSPASLSPYDIEQAVMNNTVADVPEWQDDGSVLGAKTALVGILGGSVIGFVFLIAIVTSFIYRIKTRSISSHGYDGPAEITTQASTSSLSSSGGHLGSLPTTTTATTAHAQQAPARCHLNFDFRRHAKFHHQAPHHQHSHQQPTGARGMTVWNGRSTTYMENG